MSPRPLRMWLFAAIAASTGGFASRAHAADEPALKAAFIYNFATFTTWPATTAPADRIDLCVDVRTDAALREALARLQGKQVHGVPLNVRTTDGDRGGCAILVMPGNVAATLSQSPRMLTVCDCPASANAHAVFHLSRRGTRLRFDVDRGAAAAAGLTISSRLLRLAASTQ